jgi:hypothetical protein
VPLQLIVLGWRWNISKIAPDRKKNNNSDFCAFRNSLFLEEEKGARSVALERTNRESP